MSKISTWSKTAANNNSASPNGFPEGMAPSGLNNSAREVMAALRTQHEQAAWIDLGNTPTRVSNTSFTVTGDQTAVYTVGRRIRITDTATLYGTISSSAYTTLTTIGVTLDTGAITTPTAVAVSILDTKAMKSLLLATPDIDGGTADSLVIGGTTPAAGTFTDVTVDSLLVDGNTISASTGAVNITPASGSAIVLDGTINVDAGIVTGAASITSTSFVGALTGAADTAGTVTAAAQPSITSVGTLTSLTVSGSAILGSGSGAGLTPTDGTFHINTSSAGTVTASSNADDLVIEHATAPGISLLSGNTGIARIYAGRENDNDVGALMYVHSDEEWVIRAGTTNSVEIASNGMRIGGGLYSYASSKLAITSASTNSNILNIVSSTGNSIIDGKEDASSGGQFIVRNSSSAASVTLNGESAALSLLETTTPTVSAGYGQIYTKADNKLYFQDGAGVEHEVAFV